MRIVELQGAAVTGYRTGMTEEFPPVRSAVTVGSYDGLHAGHRKIITRTVEIARSRHLRSVVVTFDPHPRLVLDHRGNCPVRLLTTIEEKIDQLSALGVDLLVVVRFDRQFSSKSSGEFIREVLVGHLQAEAVIVGYDHGFGHDRSGSGTTLHRLGKECGFTVDVIGEVLVDDEPVSSTRIRKLLDRGKIREANTCLGAPYMVSGMVSDGQKRGREIGFPTVNLAIPDPCKLLPLSGAYAARTQIDTEEWLAMMNIGRRPTVSQDGSVTVEAHILGYAGDLYGRFLKFRLLDYIREERRFGSIPELQRQLELDKKMVELYRE